MEAASEFGGVDVFVANAGITLRSDGANVPEEDFPMPELMSVQSRYAVLFEREAAPANEEAWKLLRTTPDIAEASEGFRKRTPLRRLGKPSEVADAVAYLGSDLSSYVTGIALLVDGGLLSVI